MFYKVEVSFKYNLEGGHLLGAADRLMEGRLDLFSDIWNGKAAGLDLRTGQVVPMDRSMVFILTDPYHQLNLYVRDLGSGGLQNLGVFFSESEIVSIPETGYEHQVLRLRLQRVYAVYDARFQCFGILYIHSIREVH